MILDFRIEWNIARTLGYSDYRSESNLGNQKDPINEEL